MARLREAVEIYQSGKLKTFADPEAYLVQLKFIPGLQTSQNKKKTPEDFQIKPEATNDDILLVIHQREQSVQFVNKQSELIKMCAFCCHKRWLREKYDWAAEITHNIQTSFTEVCPQWGTK